MEHALHVAHIDESSIHTGNSHHLYVVTASLTVSTDAIEIKQSLRSLLEPSRNYLHHYDEVLDRRLKIANCIAGLPLAGVVMVMARCDAKSQEATRQQLLRFQSHDNATPGVPRQRGRIRASSAVSADQPAASNFTRSPA